MVYRLSCIIVYWICKLFFKLEIKGLEVFPAEGPFILASNHASHIDPAVLAAVSPRKLGFLAKEELFINRFFRFYFNSIGSIPVKRDGSDIKTLRLALKILATKPLLIFPQGTRGLPLEQANAGVGFLCKKAKVPVIAAKVSGTEQILPKGAKFFKKGRVRIDFAKVTDIAESDSSQDIARKVMDKIKNL